MRQLTVTMSKAKRKRAMPEIRASLILSEDAPRRALVLPYPAPLQRANQSLSGSRLYSEYRRRNGDEGVRLPGLLLASHENSLTEKRNGSTSPAGCDDLRQGLGSIEAHGCRLELLHSVATNPPSEQRQLADVVRTGWIRHGSGRKAHIDFPSSAGLFVSGNPI